MRTCVALSCKDHGADVGTVSPTLRAMNHSHSHQNGGGQVAVAFDTTQITSAQNYSNPKPGDPCHPLAAGAHPPAIACDLYNGTISREAATLTSAAGSSTGSGPSCLAGTTVRRLTPTECERLQGFPDDWTAERRKVTMDGNRWIAGETEPQADTSRYKQMGNAVTVNVAEWIGQKIQGAMR
jgi:DNA (cytosine-5)-methyltransferase 1